MVAVFINHKKRSIIQHVRFKVIAWLLSVLMVFPNFLWAFNQSNYSVQHGQSDLSYLGHSITLPKKYGTITNSLQSGKQTVICIQDLHCHYEVQKNIANIISYFNQKHGLKLIGEEGGVGTLNLDVIKDFPIKSIREEVSHHYLKQGRLTGAEYFVANHDQELFLEGVESEQLYQDSYTAIQTFLNAETQGYCFDLRDALNELKTSIYHKALYLYDQKRVAYRNGDSSLLKYAVYLKKTGKQFDLNLNDFKNYNLFISSKQRLNSSELDTQQLTKEIMQVDGMIREQFYNHPAQAQLDQLIERSDLIEKLLNISVNQEELANFRTRRDDYQIKKFVTFINKYQSDSLRNLDSELFSLDEKLNQVEAFYQLADERSVAFVDQLLAQMQVKQQSIGLMVNGGFHIEKIIEELKARQITYVAIQPNLTRQDIINPYFNLLQGEKSPLERLLASNQNIFAPRVLLQQPEFPAMMEANFDPYVMAEFEQLSKGEQKKALTYLSNHKVLKLKKSKGKLLDEDGKMIIVPDGTHVYTVKKKDSSQPLFMVVTNNKVNLKSQLQKGKKALLKVKHYQIAILSEQDSLAQVISATEQQPDIWERVQDRLSQFDLATFIESQLQQVARWVVEAITTIQSWLLFNGKGLRLAVTNFEMSPGHAISAVVMNPLIYWPLLVGLYFLYGQPLDGKTMLVAMAGITQFFIIPALPPIYQKQPTIEQMQQEMHDYAHDHRKGEQWDKLIESIEIFNGLSGRDDQGYHRMQHSIETAYWTGYFLRVVEKKDPTVVMAGHIAGIFHDSDIRLLNVPPAVANTRKLLTAEDEELSEEINRLAGIMMKIKASEHSPALERLEAEGINSYELYRTFLSQKIPEIRLAISEFYPPKYLDIAILNTDFPFIKEKSAEFDLLLAEDVLPTAQQDVKLIADVLQLSDKGGAYFTYGKLAQERVEQLWRDEFGKGTTQLSDAEILRLSTSFFQDLMNDFGLKNRLNQLPYWAQENFNAARKFNRDEARKLEVKHYPDRVIPLLKAANDHWPYFPKLSPLSYEKWAWLIEISALYIITFTVLLGIETTFLEKIMLDKLLLTSYVSIWLVFPILHVLPGFGEQVKDINIVRSFLVSLVNILILFSNLHLGYIIVLSFLSALIINQIKISRFVPQIMPTFSEDEPIPNKKTLYAMIVYAKFHQMNFLENLPPFPTMAVQDLAAWYQSLLSNLKNKPVKLHRDFIKILEQWFKDVADNDDRHTIMVAGAAISITRAHELLIKAKQLDQWGNNFHPLAQKAFRAFITIFNQQIEQALITSFPDKYYNAKDIRNWYIKHKKIIIFFKGHKAVFRNEFIDAWNSPLITTNNDKIVLHKVYNLRKYILQSTLSNHIYSPATKAAINLALDMIAGKRKLSLMRDREIISIRDRDELLALLNRISPELTHLEGREISFSQSFIDLYSRVWKQVPKRLQNDEQLMSVAFYSTAVKIINQWRRTSTKVTGGLIPGLEQLLMPSLEKIGISKRVYINIGAPLIEIAPLMLYVIGGLFNNNWLDPNIVISVFGLFTAPRWGVFSIAHYWRGSSPISSQTMAARQEIANRLSVINGLVFISLAAAVLSLSFNPVYMAFILLFSWIITHMVENVTSTALPRPGEIGQSIKLISLLGETVNGEPHFSHHIIGEKLYQAANLVFGTQVPNRILQNNIKIELGDRFEIIGHHQGAFKIMIPYGYRRLLKKRPTTFFNGLTYAYQSWMAGLVIARQLKVYASKTNPSELQPKKSASRLSRTSMNNRLMRSLLQFLPGLSNWLLELYFSNQGYERKIARQLLANLKKQARQTGFDINKQTAFGDNLEYVFNLFENKRLFGETRLLGRIGNRQLFIPKALGKVGQLEALFIVRKYSSEFIISPDLKIKLPSLNHLRKLANSSA